jgi:inorganic triphosphatase YgiF
VPARGASKVGRVLGSAPAQFAERPTVRRRTPVGDVLAAGLGGVVLDLQAGDPLVRLDRPGAPTRMRAATQRLRAALAVQRQLIPDESVTALRSELAWLDSVLAELDELDTSGTRIRASLAVQPKELILGPVARRLDRELAARRRSALAAVREVLDSSRYLDLLESIVAFPSRMPAGAAAASRAGDVLPDLAERALRRAERRLAQLGRAPSDDERRWQQRGARRAVQRAGYAEQLYARHPGEIQSRLAAGLDEAEAVLARLEVSARTQDLLRELAVQAQLAGENAFTFGLLYGLEKARADILVREATKLRKHLRRLDQL